MKGWFWNSDGLKDPAKHCIIHEAVKEHKLDFLVLSETGRDNFAGPFLKHLSAGFDYWWYCLPTRGRSGGILVGFNTTTLSIQKVETGDYCVKFHVKNKQDGFLWALVAVYGAAQDAQKPDFLAELVCICYHENLPMLVGGDLLFRDMLLLKAYN